MYYPITSRCLSTMHFIGITFHIGYLAFLKRDTCCQELNELNNWRRANAADVGMTCGPPSLRRCAVQGKRHVGTVMCRHVCAISVCVSQCYRFEYCRPVISKTTHFHCCIVLDETCSMAWGSSWPQFYVNRCIFREDMRNNDFCRAMLCTRGLSSTIFSPLGSHTILVFRYQTAWQYSYGNPPSGASNAGGVGRNRDSEPISGFTACCEAFQRQVQYI